MSFKGIIVLSVWWLQSGSERHVLLNKLRCTWIIGDNVQGENVAPLKEGEIKLHSATQEFYVYKIKFLI